MKITSKFIFLTLSIFLLTKYAGRNDFELITTVKHNEDFISFERSNKLIADIRNVDLSGEENQTQERVESFQITQLTTEEPKEASIHTTRRKTATITAYSCGGLTTNEEIAMNCPSMLNGEPKTATGTIPKPYYTMACDRNNLGKLFKIEGVGVVKCEDVGGSVNGEARFDIYLPTIQEAREWGIKHLEYEEYYGE